MRVGKKVLTLQTMKKMNIKCLVFLRVSSQHQDLAAQKVATLNAAKRYYKDNEIEIVQGKESAIKRKEDERETLKEMKELVKENPSVETIYFFAVDRLARRIAVIYSIKEWADENNINLFFLNPHPFGTRYFDETAKVWKPNPSADINLMFLSYGAQMEMQIKKERFAAAKSLRRQQNKTNGKLPFGYQAEDNGNIVINPNEAKIIRWVFNSYLNDGMSTSQIFNEGVERGYWPTQKTRTGGANKIRFMLSSDIYCGRPNHVSKYSQRFPQIVDEDDVAKAIELMKSKNNSPKHSNKAIYYAKSILRDEDSNTVLICDGNRAKYKATNAMQPYTVSLNVADSIIWREAYTEKWMMMNGSNDTAKADTQQSINEVSNKIVNLKNMIETEYQPQIERNYQAYVKGRISSEIFEITDDELKRQVKKVEKKIHELVKRESELCAIIDEIERKEKIDISLYTVKGISDDAQRREIINEVIDKMTVKKIRNNYYLFKVWTKRMINVPQAYLYISHTGKAKIELYEIFGGVENVHEMENSGDYERLLEEKINSYPTVQSAIDDRFLVDVSDDFIKRVERNRQNG